MAIKDGKFQSVLVAGTLLVAAFSFFKLFPKTSPLKKTFASLNPPRQIQTSKVSASGPSLVKPRPQPEPIARVKKDEDRSQWTEFLEILKSKNDNDPRLDSDLRHLSPELKSKMRAWYNHIEPEQRNSRGMIVFLIARDASSIEDLDFLESVYKESPCLSLGDCKSVSPGDQHFASINETTLAYPQLAGLYQIDKLLSTQPELLQNQEFRSHIKSILEAAQRFPIGPVQVRAREIQSRFQP